MVIMEPTVFVVGMVTGALAWATIGEWVVRTLAHLMIHR